MFFIGFLTGSTTINTNQSTSIKSDPFTIVLLPDTQKYHDLEGASRQHIFDSQTQWIVNHLNEHNIVLVLHLGDIVETAIEEQFNQAKESLSYLDGIVPYIVTMGNHDRFWAQFPRPHISNKVHYKFFHKTFPVSFFEAMPTFGGVFKKGQIENSYHFFDLGGTEYMVITLDHRPSEKILSWANKITTQFQNKQVIVLIHEYCGDSDKLVIPHGQRVWEKFVKKHRNIQFVFSGHVSGPGRLIKKGIYGNTIFQIAANYEFNHNGGNGFFRLLRFYPKNKKVVVKTFSPHTNKYKIDSKNQFSIDLKKGEFSSENFELGIKKPRGQIKRFYKNKIIKGIWNYKDGQLEGETKIFFPNRKIKMKTYFSNGLPISFNTYYKNGQPKLIRNFKNGKLEGKAISFYKNGKTRYAVNFNNNKIYGSRKLYYKSGQLKEEKSFKDNIAEGSVIKHFKSGNIKESFNLKKICLRGSCIGKIDGEWNQYYKNGHPKAIISYALGGYEHGPAKFFSETGQLQEDKNYYKNQTHGLKTVYFPSGNIKSVHNSEFGESQGYAIFLFKFGGLRTVVSFRNGILNGLSFEYDPQGQLKAVYSYGNGKREGNTKKFEPDGGMLILTYSNDKLDGVSKRYNSKGNLISKAVFKDNKLIQTYSVNQPISDKSKK